MSLTIANALARRCNARRLVHAGGDAAGVDTGGPALRKSLQARDCGDDAFNS